MTHAKNISRRSFDVSGGRSSCSRWLPLRARSCWSMDSAPLWKPLFGTAGSVTSRSSRTILFILAGSAIVMGPIVASRQLINDKDIARRIVEESAEVGTPELETATASVLAIARGRLAAWDQSGHDTSMLRKTAFL